ncbi:MAG: helix-turn-helix domain-containing protein [Acidimicrobiales bacterium]
MSNDRPLTITVEQAAQVLGIGRSTAYELVHSGDLKCIRLRRRIVVPVAHLAKSLGVDHDAVWTALAAPPRPSERTEVRTARSWRQQTRTVEIPTLF